MKKWIVLFICAINAMASIGQNVGIGTDEPQEKLDVNGGILSHSIHLYGGSEEFRILAEGPPADTIDQQQSTILAFAGGGAGWQSFTAGETSILMRVRLYHSAQMNITLSIYEGEGTNGPILKTVPFSTAGATWQFSPSLDIPVVDGNIYTIGLSSAYSWAMTPGNSYSGGKSHLDTDMTFQTYVEVANPMFVVDSIGNVLVNGNIELNGNTHMDGDLIMEEGNIGLGTGDPLFKLHLGGSMGKIRIDGGSDSGPYFSLGGTGKFEMDAPNIPGGRLVINNDGNVGINNPSPTKKLDVLGNANISGGLTLSGASADLDVDGPIHTKFSGTYILTNITTTGLQILNLPIPQVPNEWNFTNTVVLVSNADGLCILTIHQAKLSSPTDIELLATVHTTDNARFNYIIFKI